MWAAKKVSATSVTTILIILILIIVTFNIINSNRLTLPSPITNFVGIALVAEEREERGGVVIDGPKEEPVREKEARQKEVKEVKEEGEEIVPRSMCDNIWGLLPHPRDSESF